MTKLSKEVIDVCKKINKKLGNDTLIYENQEEELDIDYIPTGLINVDLAIKANVKRGGIPVGRLIEIYGPEASGKTAFTMSIIASAQKEGKVCAFLDVENGYNPFFAKNIMGVDNENLVISQKQVGEAALDAIEAMVVSGKFDLIVLDSVAALPSEAVLKESMGKDHMAREARMWSQALRKLKGIMNKHDTTLILINQIREDVGKMFGNPETTPGGKIH